MSIVEVENLCKSYYIAENKDFKTYFLHLFRKDSLKEIKALDSVSFKVNLGESIALIGRNGAGKSTMIKLLTGILAPSSGIVKVFGNDPLKFRQRNNYHIGAVFGQRCQLRWDISAYESYRLLKNIYRVIDSDFDHTLNTFRKLLELDLIMHQPVRTLSLGQKMRVELCAAFLHKPKIVFLDEPTIGLDLFSKEAIIEFLKTIKAEKQTTIFLTTHDFYDIEALCDRTIIIEKGKIILDSPTKSIESQINIGNQVTIHFENKNLKIPDFINHNEINVTGNQMVIDNISKTDLPILLQSIFKDNKVIEIKINHPDFKDILKIFYEQKVEKNAHD